MPRARTKKVKDRINKIRELFKINSDMKDNEIANLLGVRTDDITYCKRLYPQLKSGRIGQPKKDRSKIKKMICAIINQEDAMLPFNDKEISRTLTTMKIHASSHTVFCCRNDMRIPPAKKNLSGSLNRKLLYFTKGRYIWKENGKHEIQRRKSRKSKKMSSLP